MFLWNIAVTSLAEVWIEIFTHCSPASHAIVTSLAEVWIEIDRITNYVSAKDVTSLAEVWIEILTVSVEKLAQSSHFPCGSVD